MPSRAPAPPLPDPADLAAPSPRRRQRRPRTPPPATTAGPEHHPASATAPWRMPAEPLADNARTAARAGVCPVCRRIILPGRDRVADLPTRETVHVPCVARAASA